MPFLKLFGEKKMAIGYDGLLPGEKKHYSKIYHAILSGDGSVTLLGVFKMDTLEKIIIALKYDHIELFYVDFQRINCAIAPIGMIYYIHYIVRPDVRATMNQNMENWISEAMREMQLTGNENEAAIYRKTHNYLIRNIEYDYDALQNPDAYPESFTIQGIFERKKAVCEGISKAFKLLCDRAGAGNVYVVEGTSSREGFGNSIPHAWNIVGFGAEYSHVDVTWDLGSSKVCQHNRYDYFMIPDDWIEIDHTYTSHIQCRTCSQSYFVQQHSLIAGNRTLKEFIEKKIQQKNPFMYFKVVGKNGIPNDIDNKIQNLVLGMIRQYSQGTYSLTMAHNKAQQIYFYKINY